MRNMSFFIVCAAVSSAATAIMAPSADALPIEIVYSGTVSENSFTGSNLSVASVGAQATLTVSFDTTQQGAVFGPPSFVGSLYNGPIAYSYDIGGATESGTSSSFLRFSSDILTTQDFYELEPPIFDIDPGGGYFLTTLTVVTEGTTSNPFGLVTPNIEDVAGTYDASLFDTATFAISGFTSSFVGEDLTVDIDTVTVRVIPAPGAAAAFSLAGLALVRRRR